MPDSGNTLSDLLEQSRAALEALRRLPLNFPPTDVHRDAAIQRFRAAFEIVWHTGQRFLNERESLDMADPKGVLLAAKSIGLIRPADLEQALEMLVDRNLSGHTYDAENAEEIFAHLPRHADLIDRWLSGMESRNAS